MKKTIGSILIILAVLRVASLYTTPKADSTEHQIQDWTLVGVVIAVGIGLSASKPMQKQ